MYLGKALTADLAQLDKAGFTSFWKTILVPRTELDLQPLRIKNPVRGRETPEASSFF
jgi:hypothetical protein